jgi:general stress protein 26
MTLFLLALTLLAAPQTTPEASRVLEAARATMKAASNCFLITLDDAGQPQARLMAPFDPDLSMNVWLATNRHTRKVAQIRKNPRVTLAYHDATGQGYVTLIGKARLVDDLAERRRRWKPEWRDFYPGDPEGAEFLLIQFTTERIEVMSISRHVADSPQGWQPAILVRQADGWRYAGAASRK